MHLHLLHEKRLWFCCGFGTEINTKKNIKTLRDATSETWGLGWKRKTRYIKELQTACCVPRRPGCNWPAEALLPAVTMDTLPGSGFKAAEKTAAAKGEKGRAREDGGRKRRGEEKKKKKQQLDSELKLELIPSALFNTTLFLFSLTLSPSGLYGDTFCRHWLLFLKPFSPKTCTEDAPKTYAARYLAALLTTQRISIINPIRGLTDDIN